MSFHLFVTKEADEPSRWTAISSTAYRDRDGEIVSRKALAADVARADADGDYGPLVWWHMYEPKSVCKETGRHTEYDGLVIGHCDSNFMAGAHGQFLVESGTFISEEVARMVEKQAADLALSIQFTHPPSQPHDDGSFSQIRRRERSLLPRGKESNIFTAFIPKSTDEHLRGSGLSGPSGAKSNSATTNPDWRQRRSA